MPKTPHGSLILGDQFNRQHTWFSEQFDNITYAFFECYDESPMHPTTFKKSWEFSRVCVPLQQITGSRAQGALRQPRSDPTILGENLQKLCKQLNTKCIEIQQPDEYRVQEHLLSLRKIGLQIEVCKASISLQM